MMRIVAKGVEADKPNKHSNIILPFDIMVDAVDKYQAQLDAGDRGYGIAAKQDSYEYLDLSLVTHRTLRVWVEDSQLMAEVEILDVPQGLALQKLLTNMHLNLAVVYRGVGFTQENTITDITFQRFDLDVDEEENT